MIISTLYHLYDRLTTFVPGEDGMCISTSGVCNAKCNFCPYRKGFNSGAMMTQDTFDRALELAGQERFKFIRFISVLGDELVHPHLLLRVRQAAILGKRIELVTNGILLSPNYYASLAAAGVTDFFVSTCLGGKVEYLRLYGVDKFAQVLTNLHGIANLREFKNTKNTIWLRTDRLIHTNDHTRWAKQSGFALNRMWFYGDWNGRITSDDLQGKQWMKPRRPAYRSPCRHLGTIAVHENGDVWGCSCALGHVQGGPKIGNVAQNLDIDGTLKEFRDGFIAGKRPAACDVCLAYQPTTL